MRDAGGLYFIQAKIKCGVMDLEVFHIHPCSMRSRDAIDFQSSSDLSRLMVEDGISAAWAIRRTSRIVKHLQWVLQISALLLVNASMVVLFGSSRPHKEIQHLPTFWTLFAVKLDQTLLFSSF